MALLNREVLSVFAAANAVPDTPAWIFEDRTWTFGELGVRVAAAAVWLRDHGVRPGDRVAFRARVAPAPMLALFAIPAASGTAVPVHPRLVATELRESLEAIAPCRFLGDRELGQMLRASAVKRLPTASRVPPRSSGHPWAILFTSGTAGRPKGVALPARVLVASAHASAEVLPFQRRERWLLTMTPAHIGGLSILTRSLLARKTVVALERFDAADALRVIAAKGVSRISVVPAMLDALLEADVTNRLRRLAAVIIGGAACPRSLLERCAARGIHARVTYGMTETSSQVTLQRQDVTHGVSEDSGEPLPGVEVRVAADVEGDGAGRILVRGPIVMSGYVGAKAKGGPDADGWFDTGDRGRWIEDGRLVVLGRGADMIVTGGENVAPAEVERALEACAGVRQALVFGVPDRRYGQVVAAALVADSDSDLDEGFISRKIGERLASFKRPRRLAVVSALPKTAGGKPDRAGAARLLAKDLRTWE